MRSIGKEFYVTFVQRKKNKVQNLLYVDAQRTSYDEILLSRYFQEFTWKTTSKGGGAPPREQNKHCHWLISIICSYCSLQKSQQSASSAYEMLFK